MRLTDFLQEVGRPISYYPSLKKITGSTVATIFLTQFIYWTGKQNDPDGWIYKTQDKIEEETGLSRSEQETARRQLKSKGLIEEDYRGLPRKLYYRVNIAKINDLWSVISSEALKNHNNAGIQHYCMESSTQECDNPANKSAGIQQTITETTTENTKRDDNDSRPCRRFRRKRKNNDPTEIDTEAVKDIMAVTTGTKLEGMVSESVIPTLIADYNPEAHPDYPSETAVQGIKRLIRWTAAQMSDPKAAPISNPVAFFRARAKKGMDKPPALTRQEQAVEAERREAEERRRRRGRLERLEDEREIPPESRAEIDRICGRARAAV